MKRFTILIGVVLSLLISSSSALQAAPSPGVGLLIKAQDMAALRRKVKQAPWSGMYEGIKKKADKALTEWPAKRDQVAPHLGKVMDLQWCTPST